VLLHATNLKVNIYIFFLVFSSLFIFLSLGLKYSSQHPVLKYIQFMFFPQFERQRFTPIKRKFWEEIIAYFPLIPYRPHRKRRLQKFFFAAGTSLPNCFLLTVRGYTDRLRGTGA
jgi:hypothetical protein